MMHHSVSKVLVYLRTAQLTGLLVNFLLWESVFKKRKKKFSSGDSLRMTYNSREGASNRMTEWFHCRGKICSGPAGSQYSVRWPTKHSTMFAFLRHLLDYLCFLCTSAEEGVLRNAQQKLGHHVCQGGGGWDTHAVAAMWTFHSPHSPLTHLLILPGPPQHLFTCELDGRELKTLDDCVTKLKRLDSKGRLWPQEMIMELQRGYLVLNDIETKVWR